MDEILMDRIRKGYRMEKPVNAPSHVYDIMLQCWSENPASRPTFEDLVDRLMKMVDSEKRVEYGKVADDYNKLLSSRLHPNVDYLSKNYEFKFVIPEDNDGYLLAV